MEMAKIKIIDFDSVDSDGFVFTKETKFKIADPLLLTRQFDWKNVVCKIETTIESDGIYAIIEDSKLGSFHTGILYLPIKSNLENDGTVTINEAKLYEVSLCLNEGISMQLQAPNS